MPEALRLLLLGAFLLVLGVGPAWAHKVVIAVYVEGNAIEGEVGFSSGDMAKPGTPVRILGPDGDVLGETVTDADGLFRFLPTARADHTFEADLGMGHVARTVLAADDLPESVGEKAVLAEVPASRPKPDGVSSPVQGSIPDENRLRDVVGRAVSAQVRPLRQDLAQFKEEVRFRDVLGGIGYILGLFGIAAYMAARRKEKAGN